MTHATIKDALLVLRPGANWNLETENYADIVWNDDTQSQPTEDEVQNKIAELTAFFANEQVRSNRKNEYPDFREYLDGIVKGDQDQIDAYINACKAVKEKYPKP
jgi:hypothetical protein